MISGTEGEEEMKVNVGCNSLTMNELAGICGGMLCLAGGETNINLPFRSVCTDSRETEKDSLFVALGGARVDGHDYIGAALSLGSEWPSPDSPPKPPTRLGNPLSVPRHPPCIRVPIHPIVD